MRQMILPFKGMSSQWSSILGVRGLQWMQSTREGVNLLRRSGAMQSWEVAPELAADGANRQTETILRGAGKDCGHLL